MSNAWQPIETAPRDGTIIIGGVLKEYPNGEKYVVAESIMWQQSNILVDGWTYPGLVISYIQYEPTHWLPLPEFPNE